MNDTNETDAHCGGSSFAEASFARKLEHDLEILRDAIRKASNDFNKLAWGSDGNLGADRIIESLEDLLPENL